MENINMNVLSLFDGISAGMLALQRAGINVNRYFASEIDKYAIQISKNNYPDIIHIGDVTKIETDEESGWLVTDDEFADWHNGVNAVSKIDLLIGGSPCQGFSFAGKQLNFEDPRSKLFFEFVRILKEVKPKYFLLENVKMGKVCEDIISGHLGVEPIEINSSLVSAQNRKRLYWTNIPNILQPEDKGIVLKDILEEGFVDRKKSFCLDANYSKGGNLKQYFEKHRRQLVFSYGCYREPKVQIIQTPRGKNKGGIKAKNGKVPCISSSSWQENNKLAIDGMLWRKLTPLECERLQTFPDNYTEGVSKTQRYKALGNSWTVDVLAHIFKNIV